MTITIQKEVKTTEQVELQLPAYFKEDQHRFYAIMPDKTIITCVSFFGYNVISIDEKPSEFSLDQTTSLDQITEEEFAEAATNTLDKMESAISKLINS